MIRAVPFATFDYFHKNPEGNGSDAFLGNRDILIFGILRATLQRRAELSQEGLIPGLKRRGFAANW